MSNFLFPAICIDDILVLEPVAKPKDYPPFPDYSTPELSLAYVMLKSKESTFKGSGHFRLAEKTAEWVRDNMLVDQGIRVEIYANEPFRDELVDARVFLCYDQIIGSRFYATCKIGKATYDLLLAKAAIPGKVEGFENGTEIVMVSVNDSGVRFIPYGKAKNLEWPQQHSSGGNELYFVANGSSNPLARLYGHPYFALKADEFNSMTVDPGRRSEFGYCRPQDQEACAQHLLKRYRAGLLHDIKHLEGELAGARTLFQNACEQIKE